MRAPNHPRERGQSLTELAISFVVLVLVLAVGVDLGRAYFAMISLREAAEEGAIFGSFCPTTDTPIANRARSSSENLNITVNVARPGGNVAGQSLTVTVTQQFQLTMPFVGAILGTQTIPLSASSTSTILRATCP
ncbi:MAG: pilus assembly protein [Anaerolineales bacterium]|jgi:hypothetical protein|nr:pilus assembly protein [Anaerolineales bacterium]MCW5839417.1 pilus assembly protein [Anaerolineales bacterium]MCW5886980.1 pilus assembly protein [Anaerolineales bacterium]